MKEKFNLYYRPWLIASALMMGLIALSRSFGEHGDRVLSLSGLLIFLTGVVTITLGVGGIYHWFSERGGPRRRRKLFAKLRQKGLENIGLTADIENQCYAGHLKNYYLTLTPDTNLEEYDILRISAFIIHKDSQVEILKELIKKYEFDSGQSVSFFTHKMKLPFGTIPAIEKIKNEAELLVDDLRFRNIEPISVTME